MVAAMHTTASLWSISSLCSWRTISMIDFLHIPVAASVGIGSYWKCCAEKHSIFLPRLKSSKSLLRSSKCPAVPTQTRHCTLWTVSQPSALVQSESVASSASMLLPFKSTLEFSSPMLLQALRKRVTTWQCLQEEKTECRIVSSIRV